MKHFSKLVWSTAAAFALIVAMGATSPAAAQGKPEYSAGYAFHRNTTASSNIPLGWFFDAGFPLSNDQLRIVGEVTGAYKSESQTLPFVGTIDVSAKTHTFMGGVRYSLPASGMMTPYVHGLFGVAHSSSETSGSAITTTSSSSNDGLVDIGGGVKFMLNDKWSAKVGFDYQRVLTDPASNQIRFVAGVVLPF